MNSIRSLKKKLEVLTEQALITKYALEYTSQDLERHIAATRIYRKALKIMLDDSHQRTDIVITSALSEADKILQSPLQADIKAEPSL